MHYPNKNSHDDIYAGITNERHRLRKRQQRKIISEKKKIREENFKINHYGMWSRCLCSLLMPMCTRDMYACTFYKISIAFALDGESKVFHLFAIRPYYNILNSNNNNNKMMRNGRAAAFGSHSV